MKFITLAKKTGKRKYAEAALKVIEVLDHQTKPNGLYPIYIDPESGGFTSGAVSLGALGDSAYEYLLKMWVLTDHKVPRFRKMYAAAANAVLDQLYVTDPKYSFVAEWSGSTRVDKFDHLACFTSGMFGLGARHLTSDDADLDRHMEAAKGIAKTCHLMYDEYPAGISPESVYFTPGANGLEMRSGASYYILRPEAVESLFIMWRLTKDPVYRQWGWKIVQALNTHCRTRNGFAGLRDVNSATPPQDDQQQSFFLAETLKYLYLLFTPDHIINLDEYVFNTEAHPMRIWKDDPDSWLPLFEGFQT